MPSLQPMVSISPSHSPASKPTSSRSTNTRSGEVERRENRAEVPAPILPPGRTYSGPLPLLPSQNATESAQVISRQEPSARNGFRWTYTIRIAGIDVDDIDLSEVDNYVSAYELERFENELFEVEREVKAAELAADEEIERKKMLVRKSRIGRPKGVAGYLIPGEENGKSDLATAAPGRARPSYKHLYEIPTQRRRRRTRDPLTGELMPLDDDEEAEESNEDDGAEVVRGSFTGDGAALRQPSISSGPQAMPELPKRRRRKRDPETGELLPLSPRPDDAPSSINRQNISQHKYSSPSLAIQPGERPQKRRRRRRHPVTGELMELDSNYEISEQPLPTKGGRLPPAQPNIQSLQRLNISVEPDATRLGQMPEQQLYNAGQASFQDDCSDSGVNRPGAKNIEAKEDTMQNTPGDKAEQRGKVHVKSPATAKTSFLEAKASPETEESSFSTDDEIALGPARTSLMRPDATNPSSYGGISRAEDRDSDLEEGEFEIEKILAHHLSDPRTHPKGLGDKPVMLYKVKWVGWNEPTWEPIESFGDHEIVAEYYHTLSENTRSADKNMAR